MSESFSMKLVIIEKLLWIIVGISMASAAFMALVGMWPGTIVLIVCAASVAFRAVKMMVENWKSIADDVSQLAKKNEATPNETVIATN